MGTVTIAATYGAGGSVVAPRAAQMLGLRMIDRALGRSEAAAAAQPLTDADQYLESDELHESRLTSILSRAMSVSGLWAGMPIPPEDIGYDQRIMETEKALRQAADSTGAVILGRAGVFVLAGRADTLHVRLNGPEEARCRQAMAITNTDHDQAAKEMKDGDRARRAYIGHFYPGEDWDDPRHYHLVIDSTAISLDAVVEIVVAAARDRFARIPAKT
ncbi:MAG: cytidylate kinase-like family protein [Candidatus Dormibacteraeota bacterium]|nr:cytidylate kinase-like family protein [Candidatus Dormibacteraeota bacterium]